MLNHLFHDVYTFEFSFERGGDNVYSWDCEYDLNFYVKICLNTIDTFFMIGTPNWNKDYTDNQKTLNMKTTFKLKLGLKLVQWTLDIAIVEFRVVNRLQLCFATLLVKIFAM